MTMWFQCKNCNIVVDEFNRNWKELDNKRLCDKCNSKGVLNLIKRFFGKGKK